MHYVQCMRYVLSRQARWSRHQVECGKQRYQAPPSQARDRKRLLMGH